MKGELKSKKPWKLWLLLSLFVVMLAGAAYGVLYATKPHGTKQSEKTTATAAQAKTSDETVIQLAMMGDMLAHDSVNAQAKTANGYDYTPYFTKIKPLYKDADIVFCNPETPVAGDTYGVSGYPTFNAPSAFARDLVKGAGCNVINLASNHQGDKGQAGIDASLAVWKSVDPIAYNGMNSTAEEQTTVSYFTVHGVKVAFLAFMDFSNAPSPNVYSVNSYHDTALVQKLMAEAKANAQIVLVSAHWGNEDSNTVNADQKAVAQLFVDNGATMIIGTGPHVEQAVAWLTSSDGRSVPVWYSIGNMLSSQLGINGLTSGVAKAEIHVKNSTIASVSNLSFAPTFMSYEWSAADKAAQNLLARHNLTLQPLGDANSQIQAMFGTNYSVSERHTYLETVLDASAAHVTVQ